MKCAKNTLSVFAVCLLLTSCNGYDKLLKSNDYEAKYAAAMRYYNENSCSKTSPSIIADARTPRR